MDLKTVRYLLNDWARWHLTAQGGVHCALATLHEPQGGVPSSHPPAHVEPTPWVREVIQAMAAIQRQGPSQAKAIGAVRAIYLRDHDATLAEVAAGLGIATKTLADRRQLGEVALQCYFAGRTRLDP